MLKKIFLLFFLLGLSGSFLFFPDNFFSKERLISTITVSRAEKNSKTTFFTLSDKIREGQELLKRSAPLGYTKKTKVIGKKTVELKELARQEIALVILDTQTGSVFEKRYW